MTLVTDVAHPYKHGYFQVVTHGECFECFPGADKQSTATKKRGRNVKKSFNGAGERAVRGTVVARQMKIDTDN